MRAQELRIGNWLYDVEDGEYQVEQICTHRYDSTLIGVVWRKRSCWTAVEETQPIPLTPEWLERAGALKEISKEGSRYAIYHMDYSYVLEPRSDFGFKDGGYFMGIRYDDWDADPITINRFAYLINGIQYVHQLQNLYFALTGQELELK